jgi:hypothetical protein
LISGVDVDDFLKQNGVPGIAIANTGDKIKGKGGQLDLPGKPTRIDQVEGIDAKGKYVQGDPAILEDRDLPNSLEVLYKYFRPMSTDISGIGQLSGSYLGASNQYQILRADLSQGELILPGARTGYGVLLLENDGIFEMKGNAEWYGLVLCYGGAKIAMRGGGNTPAHIYGCLMIDDGTVVTNGTADIRYSSNALAQIRNQLVVYQIFAWCGGWGKPLGRFGKDSYDS